MRDVQDLGVASAITGAGAEPVAEALISQRALCAWSHDSSIQADGGFAILEGSWCMESSLFNRSLSRLQPSLPAETRAPVDASWRLAPCLYVATAGLKAAPCP